MQKFEFLRQPLLGVLAMSRKKERKRAAHTLRSDQNKLAFRSRYSEVIAHTNTLMLTYPPSSSSQSLTLASPLILITNNLIVKSLSSNSFLTLSISVSSSEIVCSCLAVSGPGGWEYKIGKLIHFSMTNLYQNLSLVRNSDINSPNCNM